MSKRSPASFKTYAALLRGINVGGNKLLKMADVKKAFEDLGFREVKSIGASGNIVFTHSSQDLMELAKAVETGLREKFEMPISVIVRPIEFLRELVQSDPFQGLKVTPETRLHVTFFNAPARPRNHIAIPYNSPTKIFRIVKLTEAELFTVVDLSTGGSTVDAMAFIEKEFGKNLTTRTWNTIAKIAS